MNQRRCINCEATWNSLADHELETPHMCPRCGDELVAIGQAQPVAGAALTGVGS